MPWYSEKIGPLPAGIWLAVIVAGVGGGLLWRRAQGTSGQPLVDTSGVESTVPTASPLGPGAIAGGIVTPGPATNEEWVASATEYLTTTGHPADVVNAALLNYIAGKTLTPAENVYKVLAVAYLGYPPLPITTPPPTQVPSPPFKVTSWMTTGKYIGGGPHPVDYAWLAGSGIIHYNLRLQRWEFTGKGRLPKGHPFSYQYAEGIGLLKPKLVAA